MKRDIAIPYISLEVNLHGCVEDHNIFIQELKKWLQEKLDPDYENDIEVKIIESAGIKDHELPNLG